MRRPLIATTLLLALAVLGTVAFVHTLDTSRALADEPAPRPGGPGGSGGPGGPPGGPGGPPGGPSGPGGPPGVGGAPPPFDTSMAHADTMVAEMIRHLGPKANMPAESAYKNIVILKGMPASNLPKIMVYGFSRGLGVRCGECHARGDFSSDEKGNKKTARAMWKMASDINHTYLANMKDLEDEAPFVNCWTCHRGHAKPETNATH